MILRRHAMYKEDKLKVLIIDDDPIEVAILDNAISNKYTRQVPSIISPNPFIVKKLSLE